MAVELTEEGRKARAAYLREYRRKRKEQGNDAISMHWNRKGEKMAKRRIRVEGFNSSECGRRLNWGESLFDETEAQFRDFRHTLKYFSTKMTNSTNISISDFFDDQDVLANIWEAIICAYYLRSLASTANKNKHPNIIEYTQMFIYSQAKNPSVPELAWNLLFFRYAAREGMAGTYAMVPPQTEEEAAKLETHFQAAISTYKKWIKERDSYAEL